MSESIQQASMPQHTPFNSALTNPPPPPSDRYVPFTAVPTATSPISDILDFMRSTPQYRQSVIRHGVLHPFHRRYNAKPEISCVYLPQIHLYRFIFKGRELEYVEIQTEIGLTDVVYVIDGPKQIRFKTVLEAETYIADQLGEL